MVQGKRDILYYETSAKEGINVDQAFQAVAKAAIEKQEQVKIGAVESIVISQEPEEKPDSGCACVIT